MRLIDADKVNPFDVFGGLNEFAQDCRDAIIRLLNAQPTIEPPQGRWKLSGMGTHNPTATCSQCGYEEYFTVRRYNFCPNCGANMNGGI